MKRMAKTGCVVMLILLLCAVAYVLNAFFGNPISSYLAKRSVKAYLSEYYGNLNLNIEHFGYNFKMTEYYAHVASPDSVDTHFTVSIRPSGVIRYDTYENVTNGWNTWQRLEDEYRARTKTVFDAPGFELKNDIAFGELKIADEAVGDYQPISYGLHLDKLVLDEEYDIRELAKENGHVIFYMQHEDVTFETAARGMLRLKEILDENDIPFFAMDFVLCLPREEGQPGSGGPVINVREFPCSDIHEEGMAERVRAAHEQLETYYAEQDKLK